MHLFWWLRTQLMFILHFFKFVFKKIIFKTQKKNVFRLQIFFILRNCNKLSIKNKSYQKSTKINAFEQKICICHSLDYYYYCITSAPGWCPLGAAGAWRSCLARRGACRGWQWWGRPPARPTGSAAGAPGTHGGTRALTRCCRHTLCLHTTNNK